MGNEQDCQDIPQKDSGEVPRNLDARLAPSGQNTNEIANLISTGRSDYQSKHSGIEIAMTQGHAGWHTRP